ncbi:hypothetical protein D1224_14785 [Henriciella barbarensis]|uniref:Bacteriophage tail tape measure C-terminal domain-containing protein n=1 Tax=Henriciella barbarensis TaxID=86342 RepID=A0A399QNB6_9PROT|nr:phage tail tape measure C-terminal domain-containing protein [Henriciella barbarensis]RIJ20388.1 hypothetical protein D1224_14785 [Henriciella barbarensis]
MKGLMRMDDFTKELDHAGDALTALVDGPGRDAAASLEAAFSEAGASIEAALSRAARSGELDFSQMTRAIFADLASMAAEAVLARAGIGAAGTSLTFNLPQAAEGTPKTATARELSKAVAKAAAIGRRFA